MNQLITESSTLAPAESEWLHLLIGDWQVISDLAFADLVLWLPVADGRFLALAQCRPSTGAPVHEDDIVGMIAPECMRRHLVRALGMSEPLRPRETRWYGSFTVSEEFVPVVHEGKPLAVVARQANLGTGRAPTRFEKQYVDAADGLFAMIARGEFPYSNAATGPRDGAPRAADGLVRLDAEGQVIYLSPNALSCFHRLGAVGPLEGKSLVEVATSLVESHTQVDESMPVVVMGRAPWRTELESHGVAVSIRALPILDRGVRKGAVLLCRDVSELRRRERELITKDATIREIHHRVKNNLQTVSALLRLQARRMESPAAVAALQEAMRRVETIAVVHEGLSQTLDERVEFDAMIGKLMRMAAEIASPSVHVSVDFHGSFGPVPADDATPLALVLTELVTNAVEHGFEGRSEGHITIAADRDGRELSVMVLDDGVGLDTDQHHEGSGLGTRIVDTFVRNELNGTIDWTDRDTGGTVVELELRLREPGSLEL